MKVVLFSRVPRWYSFKNERLASHLTAEGFEVKAVVVEVVPTIAALKEWSKKLGPTVVVDKIKRRLLGKGNSSGATKFSQKSVSPDVFHFESHNSAECVSKLKELEPDVIVLRGCGILKKKVLDIPRIGVINPHYALLPDFRGMDVTEWSVLHEKPIAVSVHSVNKGVDTGTVLKSETISPEDGDTVGSLRDKSGTLAVRLLREALEDLRSGKPFPANRMNDGGNQFFQMHPRLKAIANKKLENIVAEEEQLTSQMTAEAES